MPTAYDHRATGIESGNRRARAGNRNVFLILYGTKQKKTEQMERRIETFTFLSLFLTKRTPDRLLIYRRRSKEDRSLLRSWMGRFSNTLHHLEGQGPLSMLGLLYITTAEVVVKTTNRTLLYIVQWWSYPANPSLSILASQGDGFVQRI